MKILGEKSLSSKTLIAIKILFATSILAFLDLCFVIYKDIRDVVTQSHISQTVSEFTLTIGIFISFIFFFILLKNIIRFFDNLKNNICFDDSNIKYLNKSMNMIFFAGLVYLAMAIIESCFCYPDTESIALSILLWILTSIFLCTSIALKIFIEIFKKAIEFKKENDFTI